MLKMLVMCIKSVSKKYDNKYLNITEEKSMFKRNEIDYKIFNYKKRFIFINLEIEG